MKISGCLLITLLFCVSTAKAYYSLSCRDKRTPCYGKTLHCPAECPSSYSKNPKAKVCRIDCASPQCKAECKRMIPLRLLNFSTDRKPNCDSPGSACHDPRFIGGDGIVFYFHGKSNHNFALVSDTNLQINARFVGHRPEGRTRDFTWIQALGLLFDSKHSFSLQAAKSANWDPEIDHLGFSYDGNGIFVPTGSLSTWTSPEGSIKIERISAKNSAIITVPKVVEILINAVPVTKEDDKIHKYRIPDDDCFVHLEVQFRFFGLSEKVEGVLGRTYGPNFDNPAKPGVAMPVVGGEDQYRTTSLLSADCAKCMFSASGNEKSNVMVEYGTLDCTGGLSTGNGIVCKK